MQKKLLPLIGLIPFGTWSWDTCWGTLGEDAGELAIGAGDDQQPGSAPDRLSLSHLAWLFPAIPLDLYMFGA